MTKNEYIPFRSEILEVIEHTPIEYTFRMAYQGEVKPGQFFEVSLPKYGEAPISVSGIGEEFVDLTIRRVGKVTNEIFKNYVGDKLFLRGPYGNGFDIESNDCESMTLITGFKSPEDVLFKEDMKVWEKTMNLILTVDTAKEGYEGKVGLVTKYIPELEIKDMDNVQVVVVGPPMMMKFTVLEFLKRGIKEENIWISQERKMCCGLGKCGHCKIDDTYICLDGPVFNYTVGKSLID